MKIVKVDWPVGLRIVGIREMTDKERDLYAWYGPAVVLVLEDGSLLFPSQDEEGNGPGALFGVRDGEDVVLYSGEA